MIPQSAIHIDGNRAWWVFTDNGPTTDAAVPCEDCYGSGLTAPPSKKVQRPCPDCDGTGRHCFLVDYQHPSMVARTLRVHVVPGMVLPIVRWSDTRFDSVPSIEDRHGGPSGDDGFWLYDQAWCDDHTGHSDPVPITLPPDAAPGMWAVQLEVHQ